MNGSLPACRRASFSVDGVPEFLSCQGTLREARDWDNPEVARLWRYNLHYFDDLNALNSDARVALHRDLIARWISENPAPVGTGWEPYPCSLRIVNWVKWTLSGNALEPAWQSSLAIQADWLSRNLERHLLGNHLFANAKALAHVRQGMTDSNASVRKASVTSFVQLVKQGDQRAALILIRCTAQHNTAQHDTIESSEQAVYTVLINRLGEHLSQGFF